MNWIMIIHLNWIFLKLFWIELNQFCAKFKLWIESIWVSDRANFHFQWDAWSTTVQHGNWLKTYPKKTLFYNFHAEKALCAESLELIHFHGNLQYFHATCCEISCSILLVTNLSTVLFLPSLLAFVSGSMCWACAVPCEIT